MDILTEITATEPVTEAVTEIATEAAKLQFEPTAFVENLKHMGVGMLVIFVLIGAIVLATVLINKLFSK